MTHIKGEITIERPVEVVFDFVADERNEPRYNPRMLQAQKTSPGPIGPGTTFEARAVSRGKPVAMTVETTGYDRPRRLESSTKVPRMDIRGAVTFDPVPQGTAMRWSWDVRPHGLLKLMTPVIARIGRRQEQAVWAGLKDLLESGTDDGEAAAQRRYEGDESDKSDEENM
ncbi:MAG TPA: SRPBCC family protein [Streptosporangiaceae bacterium]|nr:SRPBCC family protein [Streptosporangiaceae bacterium]